MTLIYNPQWDRYMDIEAGLIELMAQHGFSTIHTGGGCMGWARPCEDGSHIAISLESTLGTLEDAGKLEWSVGRYNADGDVWVQVETYVTLFDALRIAPLLPAPDPENPECDLPVNAFDR